jgi:hypothetical protein
VFQILAVMSHSRTPLQKSQSILYKEIIAASCDFCIKTDQLNEERSSFFVLLEAGYMITAVVQRDKRM